MHRQGVECFCSREDGLREGVGSRRDADSLTQHPEQPDTTTWAHGQYVTTTLRQMDCWCIGAYLQM